MSFSNKNVKNYCYVYINLFYMIFEVMKISFQNVIDKTNISNGNTIMEFNHKTDRLH